MEIIITHLSSDFDSFAGMVAAKRIYPQAQIVLPTAINQNVRKFITLYEDELPPLMDPKGIDFSRVKRVIIIDTKIASRLGPAKEALNNKNVEVVVYDHHHRSSEDMKATYDYSREVGATTTILVNIIKRKKISISPLDATLFTLGIYEDTGSFTYPGTTPKDLEAASFLMKKESNLFVVLKFLNLSLSEEQHKLLEKLIMNCKKIKISETEILLSQAEMPIFIEGLSVLTRKLSQIEDVSITICWAKMKEKIYLVGRSDDKDVDVSEILKIVGGGGHPQAASAVISDMSFEDIESKLLYSLRKNIRKPILAKDVMSYPVKVVKENVSISEVDEILKKYGHSGIPIVDKDDNLVGIITRKDIDKAIGHGLSHAPVKGFRSHSIVIAGPNTSIGEIQDLMIENGIGRIPITDKKKIIGIVTRKDILRFLYGRSYENLLGLFPGKVKKILKAISSVTRVLKYNTYLVGGIVRDTLLRIPNFDIDIVVEGDGIRFGRELSKRFNCRFESHQKFGTSILVLDDGQHIDIATARVEYYKSPAALPTVELGNIKQDLSRRDFTINAMAISLSKKNLGEILDFFGGREDLKNKKIKVLHKMSFIEDPTRIFRAVRFEKRLGFKMDGQTEKLARTTIDMNIVSRLNGVRIRDELIYIFNEKNMLEAIRRLDELGALKKIGMKVKADAEFIRQVKKILKYYVELKDFYKKDGKEIKKWRLLFIILLRGIKPDEIKRWCFEMKVRKKDVNIILETYNRWNEVKKNLKNAVKKNSTLYYMVSGISPELQVISCSWGNVYYKNIKKYLVSLSGLHLEINGETLKDMGYKPSDKFRDVLGKLFEMKLDGKISSREDEICKLKKLMKVLS
ncbi:MAG: CBS domain-containing protein [Candidatus Hydromicrobium sp.]|nr:CBS domain-containing protein [Candidatus Hydromicrobium sp.]